MVELIQQGHEPCVYDNFSNSNPIALDRVKRLTNRDFHVVKGDVRNAESLEAALSAFRPDAVVHLAGLKAVSESVQQPLRYFDNNAHGSAVLLGAMERSGCEHIIFSSSATVYGTPHYQPYDESHPLAPVNPYGRTKMLAEEIIRDWCDAKTGNSAVLLRYFNPAGAHSSGLIGEDPNDIPNNLMPYISQVAIGKRAELSIFGADYDTRDGTGERDYIHVVDLARAHLATLDYCLAHQGCKAINVGTGAGTTVIEMIRAFEAASNHAVPYRVVDRRLGDLASSVADPSSAHDLMGWRAELSPDDICRSAWFWQSQSPDGYKGK